MGVDQAAFNFHSILFLLLLPLKMAILWWQNSEGLSGQFEVATGCRRIGRNDENDYKVPDQSVSGAHAELELDNGNLVVRDLGSTNGTIVGTERVAHAVIRPGERFRLGNAQFVFGAGAAAKAVSPAKTVLKIPGASSSQTHSGSDPVSANEVEAAPAPLVENPCALHSSSPAVYTCTKCGRDLCVDCTRLAKIGAKDVPFCKSCGGKCARFGHGGRPQPQAPATFGQMLSKSFAYPFKGNGLILLVTGTIFFGFLDVLTSSRLSMARGGGILLIVITYGYLFAYMQKVVCASAEGDPEPPTWPEVTDMYQDIIQPFFLFLSTLLASFLPGFILSLTQPLAGTLLLFLGAIYFPMAVLAVAMADSIGGLNPLIVISAILKVPAQYIVAVIVCGILLVVRGILPSVVDSLGIPILPKFLLAFFGLLLIMIEMRILGVLYFTNKRKFGWF
jgi:pSer/pThr/pTyr-binding forkhead associated (FHA) protein